MKQILLVNLFLIQLISCSTTKNEQIFIRQIDPTIYPKVKLIDTKTKESDLILSDEFWSHFTSNFESASVELFIVSRLPFPSLLSDTSYEFAMITNENKAKLTKYLPTNLNETESHNYVEEQAIRLPKNTPNFKVDTLHRKWNKAPASVEKEYLQFYNLISNTTKDYIILVKKPYLEKIITKLKYFG